jgi:general secretion pathway protein C
MDAQLLRVVSEGGNLSMGLDQALRSNFWVVVLSMLGGAAYFGAQGVGHLVAAGMLVDEELLALPAPADKPLAPQGAASTRNVSALPILDRNPFDSVTGSLTRREPDPNDQPQGPAQPTSPVDAPDCEGMKVLIITSSSDPNWSFAAIQTASDQKNHVVSRGRELAGKTVAYVGLNTVWFMQGQSLCKVQMFKPPGAPNAPPPPPVAAAPAPPPPGAGGPGSVPPEIAKGIQRISANEFNIDRSVVDKVLENQADLMRNARIVPEQENGKTVGIRMFGIRPDTLLGVLGFENGDRIQSLNGFDIANPEKALEAYARLRTADHLTVSINRRGSGMNVDYNIK